MALSLFVVPRYAFQDDNGAPANGWKLYTYEPGTSTPKAAYQDKDGATPHSNPITLDARGEATIYTDGLYKFVLTNAAGVPKWTEDNIGGVGNGLQTGYLTKNVAGNSNVALTSSEQNYSVIEFTGALTGNINVTVGDTKDGYRWILKNSTTGSYTLTFKTTSGTGVTIARGSTVIVLADAANIVVTDASEKVSTVAVLRLTAPISGRRVYLKAHTTEGDGGHGWFRGVTGAAASTYTDNGGTIIVPTGGDGSAAWLRDYSGSVNARWFGGDLVSALATGEDVYAPGAYSITTTLSFAQEGQTLFGDGKAGQTVIENSANANPLFTFSTGTGAVYRRRCGIRNVEFVGNALTTEGVSLRGIIDDLLTGDADKSCWMENVRIRDVGAGFGLRVSSWSNNFTGVEIWSCNKGLKCGSEFNANGFYGLYISGCTNEAIQSPNGAGIPANNSFVNAVAQYSGGTSATIDLQEAYGFEFVGLYLEGNTSPCNVLLGSLAQGCTVQNVTHNLTTGTSGIQVINNQGKGNTILGVLNLGGTVDSLVRIEGTLPTTVVGSLYVATGTATNGEVYDLSTRKATVRLDGTASKLGPSVVRALTTENAFEVRRSDTDAVQMFIINGVLYIGSDTTVPGISRAGGSIEFPYGATYANLRPLSLILGANNVRVVTHTASPEGAITADPGSICTSTAGGAGTTLYVKETGTGNTGWVAK